MKFGNWNITEATIEWSREGLHRFIIERQNLLQTVSIKPFNGDLYRWIVLATDEEWLTDDDLYDLNFAFVFAAGAFAQNFDYDIFDATLEYQFNILEDEEQSEP